MQDYIFLDQDLTKLVEESRTTKKHYFNRVINQCDLYFVEQLPKEHPPSSTTFMGMAIANLSLAYLLTRQKRYLDEAKRWMMTVVNYPHWGNAHLVDVDLSAAWILFGLGIGYDWLKYDLTREEKIQIQDKLILQGTRMYDFKIKTEGSGWSTNYFQNHNWINMTGLSTSAYALIKEGFDVQSWIDVSKENFEIVYDVMPEDGSDYEGVVYWRYGAMWLFVYAHLLKEREGIDYFRSCKFLENTFFYRLYQAAPNLEEQINFGDAHDRRSGHSTAIYFKVASEYKNGYAQKLGNLVSKDFLYREAYESKVKPGILPECFFEMLFYNPEVDEKGFEDLPLTTYFEDLGLVVDRSSWDEDATHISFKCGHPGGKKQWEKLWELKKIGYNCFGLSHQHPDNNSFILNAHNTFYAIDDGYNRNVNASDHNLVIVDGQGYVDEGVNNIWKNYTQDMIAEVTHFKSNEEGLYVIGESSKVYKPELKLNKYVRHLVSTKNGYYIMFDQLESDEKHTYTWIMHTDFYPEKDTKKFVYNGPRGKLELHSFSSETIDYQYVDNNIRAVMTTQEPDKFTENKMKALQISNTTKTEEMNFFTVLIPTKGEEVSVSKVECQGGYVVEVSSSEFKDTYIVNCSDKVIYNNTEHKAVLTVLKNEKELDFS